MKTNTILTSPTVSVIVVTYNQELKKIIKTLGSIVIQEGVFFEIIICDDGSNIRYEDELKSYFSRRGFTNYTLIFHEKNVGTVSNYYSGLKVAKGKYSKLISPGDYLTNKRILKDWVQFLEEKNAAWSFSDVCYYRNENEKMIFFSGKSMPQMIRPYIVNDISRCIWNYIAIQDVAHGAAIIGKTQIQKYYCERIKDKGIVYCEDFIYRLMMFYGIVGHYFSKTTICYEVGTGISTMGNDIWIKKLLKDKKNLTRIMLDEKNKSDQQKKMIKALIIYVKKNKISQIFIRGKLLSWVRRSLYPRLSAIPNNYMMDGKKNES